jgi:hypothetical protein
MELVLRGLTWRIVLVYLDDVIVLGRSFDGNLENLREAFLSFRNVNLKLKPVKCIIFQDKTEFLGKLVSKDGIRITPKKLDAIHNWPVPSNRKQLESFIGYVNYHRAHIQGFAGLMRPLHNLNSDSKNSKVFVWGDDHQEVFIQLKNFLATAPRLAFPLPEGRFVLDTDASDVAIRAELSQIQDGVERTVSYASNALLPVHRKYCTTRKELLAVVKVLQTFPVGPMIYREDGPQ